MNVHPRQLTNAARCVASVALALSTAGLITLHLLPTPHLRTTTGKIIAYQPVNFLSELVRTEYAPLMIACFLALAIGAGATAVAVRHLRREAALVALAGIALLLLAVFPTDLADLSINASTCASASRLEPCTLAGRVHNPLSTFVFVPLFLTGVCVCARSRTEAQWRGAARLAVFCGVVAVCGVFAASLYLHNIGWHGRWWTGLMQRSLVFPALAFMGGLLYASKASPGVPSASETEVSRTQAATVGTISKTPRPYNS